jgi:hypothetical protein
MHIKNHGVWQRYTPSKLPQGAPASALFAKRIGDGVDWYDYVNSGKNFAKDTIKLTLDADGIVSTAVNDPTLLFPGGATVLEISGVTTNDPLKLFGRKRYDADQQTFRDPPPLPEMPSIADILKRLDALENKG